MTNKKVIELIINDQNSTNMIWWSKQKKKQDTNNYTIEYRYKIHIVKSALDDDEKVLKTNPSAILTEREKTVIVRLDVLRYSSHITFQKFRDNLSWFPLEIPFIDKIIP